jgi:hypothetical protein
LEVIQQSIRLCPVEFRAIAEATETVPHGGGNTSALSAAIAIANSEGQSAILAKALAQAVAQGANSQALGAAVAQANQAALGISGRAPINRTSAPGVPVCHVSNQNLVFFKAAF